jgi:ABC-2 type transport system ATP-binding protein
MTDPMIEARGVGKRFGKTQALSGVTFQVEKGTVLGLLGPNGAGKTTMIRVLTTLLRPDAGQARVAGFDVVADGPRVRSAIGLAGQYAAVDELLTGRENLELVGLWYHLPKREYRRRAQETLDRLSLTDASDRQVKTYSGGMRRRLDIGASLIANPPVLFLDEPTTGLDPRTRNDLWQFVRELVRDGTTVLLTTQYMAEAEYLANRIVVIDQGREIAEGTADALKTQTGGATLEARVADPADLSRAAALLADVANAQPRSDPEARVVSVPAGEGTGLLLEAGRRLQEAGIALDDLGVRRPTLDEVFLALTGGGSPEHAGSPRAGAAQ